MEKRSVKFILAVSYERKEQENNQKHQEPNQHNGTQFSKLTLTQILLNFYHQMINIPTTRESFHVILLLRSMLFSSDHNTFHVKIFNTHILNWNADYISIECQLTSTLTLFWFTDMWMGIIEIGLRKHTSLLPSAGVSVHHARILVLLLRPDPISL